MAIKVRRSMATAYAFRIRKPFLGVSCVPGQPSVKRNMVWNTAGLGVEIASGFILLPFLISRLGEVTYGTWVVLSAIASYFALVEFGVRGSIGRHVAFQHSQGDQKSINRTLTSGLLVFGILGALSVLAMLVLEPFFFRVFEIAEADYSSVSTTYRIVSLHFFISLLGTAFDATLWGFQRFDWLNLIDIPTLILRIVLIYFFVRASGDLSVLGTIMLTMAGLTALGKCLLCFRADPQLRIGPAHYNSQNLRELLGYGGWNGVTTLARLTRTQLGSILIGSLMGLNTVALFAIASRLTTAIVSAITAVMGVLTPHATALHAANQVEKKRQLFFVGGLHCSMLSVFLSGILLAIGNVIIAVWVGDDFLSAERLLTLLVLGELLPNMQFVTISFYFAMARHRVFAVFNTVEMVAVSALLILLIPPFGTTGAGLAIAIPAFFARGIAPLIHACWMVDVPLGEYLRRVIVPSLTCLAIPVAVTRLISSAIGINTWTSLIVYSLAYTLIFGLCYTCIVGRRRVMDLIHQFQPSLRRSRLTPSSEENAAPSS